MKRRRASLVLLSLAAAAPLFSAQAATLPTLPFIEDDYPRAIQEARSKKLPVFVEAWAPW